MAEDSKPYVSFAAEATKLFCMYPEARALTSEQQNALHVFKHEVLSAMYRLYMVVPNSKADPVLSKIFITLPEDWKAANV